MQRLQFYLTGKKASTQRMGFRAVQPFRFESRDIYSGQSNKHCTCLLPFIVAVSFPGVSWLPFTDFKEKQTNVISAPLGILKHFFGIETEVFHRSVNS